MHESNGFPPPYPLPQEKHRHRYVCECGARVGDQTRWLALAIMWVISATFLGALLLAAVWVLQSMWGWVS